MTRARFAVLLAVAALAACAPAARAQSMSSSVSPTTTQRVGDAPQRAAARATATRAIAGRSGPSPP